MAARSPEVASLPQFPESSFKYNPIMHVRVLFVRFVQGLFHSAPPGCYHWTSDDEQSEIYITDEEVIQPTAVQRRPGISFVRGPMQFYGLGLDDLEGYEFDTAKKTKGVLLPGTMTINCCSKESLESEHIAFVTADHIWLLRDLLMKQGFFEIGRGIQVGSPSKAGSIIALGQGEEMFCTPITVPFQFTRLSSFTPLGAQVVNNIKQTMTVGAPPCVLSEGAPAQGHEVPTSMQYVRPESFAPNARDLRAPMEVLQPHPLNPSQMVCVRTIRPNNAAARLHLSRAAIPIDGRCVEQSCSSASTLKQKG